MAKVSGAIHGGYHPLELVLILVSHDLAPNRNWPKRQSSFGHMCLATGRTNDRGQYELEYWESDALAKEFIGGEQVVLQVYSEGVLVMLSPVVPWGPDIVIGGDIVSPDPPRPPRDFKVKGVVTTCPDPGHFASGYVITAYQITKTGFVSWSSSCILGGPNIRFLGSSVVGADGRYSITYQPSQRPANACAFVVSIYIEISGPSGEVVWTSDEIDLRHSITIDHALLVDCDPNSTLIHVVDQFGHSVAGAEVTSTGAQLGITNSAGYLSVSGLVDGQKIAARNRLVEHETSRPNHGHPRGQNWKYRCYTTSVSLEHDENGDGVSLAVDTVDGNSAVQELRVLSTNPLVGLNLLVSVEWDATQTQLFKYRDRILETSELIYNATDGQFCIEQVSVLDNARHWDSADIRIYSSINRRSTATLNGINNGMGRTNMNPIDAFFPGTLLHEFGHYIFDVNDEYVAGIGWDPDNGPVRCTLASSSDSPDFGDGAGKDSSPMRGAQFNGMKKFCSSHPANPHVDGTRQGPVDCWTCILETYGPASVGLPSHSWRPRGPLQRGAIVGRLPDSGTPLATITTPAPNATNPLSFIPFQSWKPNWHTSSVELSGECPDLKVKVVLESGIPVGGASVYLQTAEGRSIDQGMTRAQSGTLADGSFLENGELSIRGAHTGDHFLVTTGTTHVRSTISQDIVGCPPVFEITVESPFGVFEMNAEFDEFRNLVVSIDDASVGPLSRVSTDDVEEPGYLSWIQHKDKVEATVHGNRGNRQIEIDTLLAQASGTLEHAKERFTITDVSPWTATKVCSFDGQLELDFSEQTAPDIGKVAIQDVFSHGQQMRGWIPVAGPFRIFSSFGNNLSQPTLLHFLPSELRATRSERCVFSIMRFDPTNAKWREIQMTSSSVESFVSSARISELGTYVLFEKISASKDQK